MHGDMLADVPAPFPLPIGLRLSQTARAVERAFDEALGEAGGTLPVWLVLLNLKIRKPANQRELAEAVGVREATLTHHLNAMDARGLYLQDGRTPGVRLPGGMSVSAGSVGRVLSRFILPCVPGSRAGSRPGRPSRRPRAGRRSPRAATR